MSKPTKREWSLVAAADIFTDAPSDKDLAFLTRYLVQCTLPHRNPGNVPVWTRSNGNLTLGIVPGIDLKTRKPVGFPYGSVPRLLLYWMTAEAARTRNPRLELGHSLASFMREVGLDPSRGGKRSDARRLREQMERLFRATISFQQDTDDGSRATKSWLNMQVAPKGELWWHPKQPEQAALWGSWIQLGPDFFDAITSSLIPLDTRALAKLKRSPLDLDLYAWCAYNAFRAQKSGNAVWITWRKLAQALGADYGRAKNFQQKALGSLKRVQLVFPGLHLGYKRGAVEILPTSLPPVPAKPAVDKSGD
jgi:hypothetical protein